MTGADDRPRMKLLSFKPIGKAGLAGFAVIELSIGLRIADVPVFVTGQSGPWAGLPRRPVLDRDRRQRIGADGRPAFEPICEWNDREASNRFSAAVVELVRAAHPEVFEARAA